MFIIFLENGLLDLWPKKEETYGSTKIFNM